MQRPDGPVRKERLSIRHVQLRPICGVEPAVLDVAGNADNLVPLGVGLAERDAFADRAFVRPVLARHAPR